VKPVDFDNMHLKTELLDMIRKKGFWEPTPIQVQTIPLALDGHDIMGQARTGTGKTASFGIPILNCLVPGGGMQALIICPTRELSVQVRNEIASLGQTMGIQVVALYGGQSIEVQFQALGRQPEIVVATPGRLLDHLRRGSVCMEDLRFVVLDEADEMLDMGFLPDIEMILSDCPTTRQTFLFSATLPEEVRELGMKFMQDPVIVLVDIDEPTVPIVEQRCYRVHPGRKVQTLCQILEAEKPQVSLVFCRTKKGADELAYSLKQRGFKAESLHGDMSQRERDQVMNKFRRGRLRVLVATDLASRGLDVDMVTHVINFDIPDDPDIYVHRIGRTGRAGRDGVAITLVEPSKIKQLRMIESRIDRRITVCECPGQNRKRDPYEDELFNRVVKAARSVSSNYRNIARRMLDQEDAVTVLAGALKLLEDGYAVLDKTPSADPADESLEETTVNVEIPLGKAHGIKADQLIQWLVNRTLLSEDKIGDIEVEQQSTYIEVPFEYVDEIYQVCDNLEYIKQPPKRKHRPFAKWGRAHSMTGR
jgi:ATP-dependent RNA helicase DeaD